MNETNSPALVGQVERPVRPGSEALPLMPSGIAWDLALLAQTLEFSEDVRCTIQRGADEVERGAAALSLLKRIRYHSHRHALPRDWLTAADEVLGTWGPVKLDHSELKA